MVYLIIVFTLEDTYMFRWASLGHGGGAWKHTFNIIWPN